MDESDIKRKDDELTPPQQRMAVGWIPLQAGCLTFGLAMIAILVGLWLDVRLGTTPRWTLVLLIGSAPFALGGVYFIVRRSLRGMNSTGATPDSTTEE